MTCPLCGVKEHDGPCYKELRDEWRSEDWNRKMKGLSVKLWASIKPLLSAVAIRKKY